ncbi:ABC transporter C family member 5 isoform X2 [Elaeis guineensis]|uniref:ABC transporter C family member 5 isoform X3 n=1 Tax=Elaeis guineensis var. tenera TaxID=51953 RepID=A0A6I9S2S6_ELAGV|nr:ABC transporter C family member 5 isoform X3 [Elaeis guineensis]
MGSFHLFSSFEGLPLPEKVSVAVHSALLLFFLFFVWARRVLSGGLRRVSAFKEEQMDPIPAHANSGGGRVVVVSNWFKISTICCFYVSLLQLAVLGYETVNLVRKGFDSGDYSVLCLPSVQALAWLVLGLSAVHCKFKESEKFPALVRLWWFLSFSLCVYIGYVDAKGLLDDLVSLNSRVIANYASAPALAFLCLVAFRGATGVEVYGDLREPLLGEEGEEAGCLKVTPYSEAGLLSLGTLSWLNPLLSVGAKRPLELRDVPLLAPKDRAKTSYKILNLNWERLKAENPTRQPSLALAIFQSFWKEAAMNGVFAFLNTVVSYVGPYLISYFVDYLSGNIAFPHEGYILASIFFVAKLVETLTIRQWYLGVDILGMHVRSGLTAMVYQKGLRLSNTARQSHTSGEIVNYMAVDVQRVGDYSWYLHDIWMLPLQIVLALVILYKNVGVASFATLVATIISIIVTIPLAKMQEDYQDKLMAAKDERMRKTSECLRNMRILKLQAWEDRYRSKLEEMRNVEFRWLQKALYSQAFVTFIFWGSPIFVSIVTFGTSILLGDQLTAGGVLSALATFRILQEPLRNFPDLVSMIAQTKVSLDRILGFLQEEELQGDATIAIPRGITNTAIEIKDGEFCWDPSSPKHTLSAIQVKVDRGMRVAVCGAVGAGKSSFLSCILGEIPKISGEVKVCGSAAYVSQSAWIQSGNIEENILFGSPVDKQRYKTVLHACSLKKDLELFSHGDQTIIGDRGINLSGGQKQRVQLARALYQDADIYLLDDPFSAVDAHTGSELFKEYIMTALVKKTVIFVTHQVEFLPAADLILVLKEGCIIQAGKYEDLLEAGTDFDLLVSAHHEAIEAMDIPEVSSEDSEDSAGAGDDTMFGKKLTSSANNLDTLNSVISENEQSSDRKAIKEKKKSKRMRRKQLVQEEERERGKISFKVYLSYMAAAYKGTLIPLIILAQATFQVLQIASSWWMAWANPQTAGDEPKTSSVVLLVVYMALAFGSSLFIFVRAVLVATFGLAAAQKLFVKMLRTVFRAPMSFFDSTPAGRILNRTWWICINNNTTTRYSGCDDKGHLASFASDCSHGYCLLMDAGMAGLAVTYGLNLNARLSRWILSFCKLENKVISIERIHQYCQIPGEAPPVIENHRPPSSWPESGKIELIDLKVRYKENLPTVLHGINCTFPGGKKIGIVGRTGSGKSTLIQALFRLIEPSSGKIIIDNIDISTIGLHDLRSRLSIIPQDPSLFEGTIRGNLDPLEEHSDHEVWQALDKCQLGEVIRQKEQKLDALVLENGDNWSVGQRQLVSLGRALLKQAQILVLDEATASVDTATDNLIQKIIRTEFRDCTVCTIAHRIPTVIDSDLVLVLNDGRVAEFDSPLRLLEDKSSMFLKLVTEYSTRSSSMTDG